MPLSAAATRTALVANVTRTETPVKVNVELIFRGVTFVPSALYDALDAAYGTVATPKDAVGHAAYVFEITP